MIQHIWFRMVFVNGIAADCGCRCLKWAVNTHFNPIAPFNHLTNIFLWHDIWLSQLTHQFISIPSSAMWCVLLSYGQPKWRKEKKRLCDAETRYTFEINPNVNKNLRQVYRKSSMKVEKKAHKHKNGQEIKTASAAHKYRSDIDTAKLIIEHLREQLEIQFTKLLYALFNFSFSFYLVSNEHN